jgi:ergothioneine biosynthesis protein EgtB
MADVSPIKWHLAHTSWFFETFVLDPHMPGYRAYRGDFAQLFNSYYQGAGPAQRRVDRGLRSRPTVKEIYLYRRAVDDRMREFMEQPLSAHIAGLIRLGVEHEQQHQELILTDIKHVLSCNPELPVYKPGVDVERSGAALQSRRYPGGVLEIGSSGESFCFDNETARHRVFIAPYRLGSRAVSNQEFGEFIRDGGYQRPTLWLSDGWTAVLSLGWSRPLYWQEDLQSEFTLRGLRPLQAHAPVVHISYYEAEAYARWAGARLPTEAEWETAAATLPVAGNFLEGQQFQPLPAAVNAGSQPQQIFGDVWEWTQSAYAPYPGFRPFAGMVGEYNGKFMANQFVLRGGSCASPAKHLRAAYRNFFYPSARWQFSGLRIAWDD